MQKRLLIPERVRRVPQQFSWVDQRLVRERHLKHCGTEAWALYLFLVIVGDARGLSYYADASIRQIVPLDGTTLKQARKELIRAGLIAYQWPLYQVLALEAPPLEAEPKRSAGQPRSMLEVLRQALGEHS